MSMTEVRLFELARKGDRLDELNAEEVFNRQATAAARRQAFQTLIKRLVAALNKTRSTESVNGSEGVLSLQR